MNTQQNARPAWPKILIAFAVGLLTFALYWQTRHFEYVRLDDGVYALEQPMIERGFTWEGVKWAFTNRETANLQPVTWLSLMLDAELWGVNIGAMHLHNALLHALNAGLLFLFLLMLTGRSVAAPGRPFAYGLFACAAAALFWSLHPLRAESVAWVSSRKDVLSGVFCLLGLMAWLKNVRAYYATDEKYPDPITGTRHTGGASVCLPKDEQALVPPSVCDRPSSAKTFELRYDGPQPRYNGWNVFSRYASAPVRSQFYAWASFCVTLLLFVLGYGAKPTMMIFPGFLALVEWLETGRIRWKPLAAMGAIVVVFGWLTVFAQTIAIDKKLEGTTRLFNGFVSYLTYWSDTFAPHHLCIFYPYGLNLTYVGIAVGAVAVALSLLVALVCWKRCPTVTFLFGWFVCGLVPVIGFIHVGIASHADRYTYLPALGISIALARGLCALSCKRSGPTIAGCGLLALGVAGYAALAHRQISTWKNNFTVFSQAIRAVPENAKAWQQLGSEYANRFNNPDEAVACYRKSLTYLEADECAGQLVYALALRGKPGDFEEVKQKAAKVAADPELDDYCGAVTALGVVAMREQRWPDAVRYLSVVARKKPTPQAYLWFATSLYQAGQIREAIEHFREVEETAPKAEDRAAARSRLEYIRQKHGYLFPAQP